MAGPGIQQGVPAEANQVPRLRRAAVSFAEAHTTPSDETRAAIALAVTEACTNVVRHAYPNRDGEITFTMRLDDGNLIATIIDHGIGLHAAHRSATHNAGLGLPLMHALADTHMTTNHHGTHVELRFPTAS